MRLAAADTGQETYAHKSLRERVFTQALRPATVRGRTLRHDSKVVSRVRWLLPTRTFAPGVGAGHSRGAEDGVGSEPVRSDPHKLRETP